MEKIVFSLRGGGGRWAEEYNSAFIPEQQEGGGPTEEIQ